MKEIYLAMACVDYEGSSVIKAFSKECDAREYVDKCTSYESTKVNCPEDMNDEAAWDVWHNVNEKWLDNHPAGRDSCADYYSVSSCELSCQQETKMIDELDI